MKAELCRPKGREQGGAPQGYSADSRCIHLSKYHTVNTPKRSAVTESSSQHVRTTPGLFLSPQWATCGQSCPSEVRLAALSATGKDHKGLNKDAATGAGTVA